MSGRATETGVLGEQNAFTVNLFKESVRGVVVIVGDVDPDLDQVILCPGGATNSRHRAWLCLGSIHRTPMLVPAAPSLCIDRVYILEATGAAGEPLDPQPTQFLDITLLEDAPLFPLSQCLANHLAGGRIFSALDGAPDQDRDFRGEGDAKFLDVCHWVRTSWSDGSQYCYCFPSNRHMADRVNSPTAKDQMLPKASGTQGSAGRQRAFSLRFGLNSGSPGAD